jgi:hypothetical protein
MVLPAHRALARAGSMAAPFLGPAGEKKKNFQKLINYFICRVTLLFGGNLFVNSNSDIQTPHTA